MKRTCFFFLLANNNRCLSVETTASTLKLAWCQGLANVYHNSVAFALVGLKIRRTISRTDQKPSVIHGRNKNNNNNNLTQYMADIQSMKMSIRGLRANTEYQLKFDIKSFAKNPRDGHSITRYAARRFRTKYYCTLTMEILVNSHVMG